MEYIWSQVPKTTKDGVEYVVYTKDDIPFLYNSGLVDTSRYSLELWQKAFEDCEGEDGQYWVSHNKMIWLGRFRYGKVPQNPFDPLKMRTGRYTVERLWNVFESSIIPSSSLSHEFFKNTFDRIVRQHKTIDEAFGRDIKKFEEEEGESFDKSKVINTKYEVLDGQEFVLLERENLANLRLLLDQYPSPKRKLEVAVEEKIQQKLQQLSDMAGEGQKSAYEGGSDFRETTKQSLKDMLVKASEKTHGGRKPKDEVLDLKSLQKKNRPTKF